ncbi:MAG: hypothetical protein CMC46_01030 [Flavobacteriaceae bacterium]|jgi:hypothetical protein|nr:hypothetical protein [Flavobacteriaceae bacterium]|tara:strand:+ start:915 stop:1622 length:708 start_codon:yes stop_codon:yes gene_type:complete
MRKKNFLKYLFDFIVIVLGITVSFWFNQLSIKKNNDLERLKVLNSIEMEISEIENYTKERLNSWNDDIDLYSEFLSDKLDLQSIKNITSSKSRIEYNLIYYRDFEPPMNRYNSMISSGNIKYIDSEKLKEILTRLHNLNYSNLKTTVEYEKSLKEQLIQILTKNHSNILLIGDDNKTSLDNYSKELYNTIKADNELKTNLIIQMKYFKTRVSLLKLYNYTLSELKDELSIQIEKN